MQVAREGGDLLWDSEKKVVKLQSQWSERFAEIRVIEGGKGSEYLMLGRQCSW